MQRQGAAIRNATLAVGPAFSVVAALLLTGAGAPVNEEQLWRHRNLGKALFETPATISQAIQELKQAHDLAPDSYRDGLNYGIALLRAGRLDEAIAELEKAQKRQPEVPNSWFSLGIAYKRKGRHADAIRQFERMAQLVPDEPVTRYNLGRLYNLTGREREALKQFQAAARLDSRLVAPRSQIYNLYSLQGKDAEAAKALADFLRAKEAEKTAGESEDMDWCAYAELYDPVQARPAVRDTGPPAALEFRDRRLAGSLDAKSSGLLAIDAYGLHQTDLLAWSRRGIRLYRNGRVPVRDSGLEGIHDVIAAAAADFDNDGFPDLCVLTEAGARLYRNEKGRFRELPARDLPTGHFDAALWLDFDHDHDYDLFLFGEKSVLLRNENGSFRNYTAKFPLAAGHVTGAVAFRSISDTKEIDLVVAYADRTGMLYRDRLHGEFEAIPLDALPAGARSLQAADVNNDGWIDLAFTAPAGTQVLLNRQGRLEPGAMSVPGADAIAFADVENRGWVDLVAGDGVYRNLGLGQFDAKSPVALPAATAWAKADFDGDGRPDLAAVAPDGTLHLLANRTATKNSYLRVALNGIKNPKTALGAEVEVKAGDRYQKKIYEGVPLLFGLGQRARVDTVRVAWPNGMIQNQPEEAARSAVYTEAPRMSGSCPMVFTWNGRGFTFLGDVLGVAPLGASAGDGSYFPVTSQERLAIPAAAIAPRNGRYEVRITEELHEVSYIDKVRLIAVDHDEATEIFTNDKFQGPPFPEFRLYGVKRRIRPVRAVDGRGIDLLPDVLRRDGVYARGFAHDSRGRAGMHSLELEFPAGIARDGRAILVLNGWIDWADGSAFLAAAQGRPGLTMPYLQVRDGAGRWRTVIEDMGVPSGGPKTIVVDLTGKFLSASREIRIVTDVCLYWDEIFLSEETGSPPVRLSEAAPAADLSLRGFSRAVVDPRGERPERFEYAAWRPAAMWNPVPGLYTRYGDVSELLDAADDRFVIMGSGDELRSSFAANSFPALPAGSSRDFLLLVDGWSKDADANTAFGDSVEPLPFHAMSQYPYTAPERFPDDAAHRDWARRYNNRREIRIFERLAGTAKPRLSRPGE